MTTYWWAPMGVIQTPACDAPAPPPGRNNDDDRPTVRPGAGTRIARHLAVRRPIVDQRGERREVSTR